MLVWQMDKHFLKKTLSGRHTGLITAIMMVMVLSYIFSCSRTPKTIVSKMTVIVESESDTNKSQPFYIVFRSVNVNEFLTQTYQNVADMVFNKPDDLSLLGTQLVIPGEKFKMIIEQPVKNNLGVYSFFTEPSDKWKMMIPQPLEKKYVIKLESNEIFRVKKKKGILKKALFFLD